METKDSNFENPRSRNEVPLEIVTSSNEPRKQQHHHHHHHKHEKKFRPDFNIPGVHKVVLNLDTQYAIGCVTGDTVTSEKPWTVVDKTLIEENLEFRSESSELLPLKDEILQYPGAGLLMGYIPDESKDYDEFYVCVTEEATDAVKKIIEKTQQIQEERLENAIHRKIKKWKTLGSHKEIDESIMKSNRTLIKVEIESKYPILRSKVYFKAIKSQDLCDGYMSLEPVENIAIVQRKRIDAYVQVIPNMLVKETQTDCTYPRNAFTQYEYKIPDDVKRSKESVNKFQDYINQNIDTFCDILRVNCTMDFYINDYENLVRKSTVSYRSGVSANPRHYLTFINMNLSGAKMVSSFCWHPMWSGCALMAYVENSPFQYLTDPIASDDVYKAVHDTNPVLFWSFKDDLKPKLILEAPRPVYVLSCCPYNENLVIGGCINGQIILWDITNKLSKVEEEAILTIEQLEYKTLMFSLMKWMKNIFDLARVRPAAISDLKYSHRGCINSISWMSPFHSVTKCGKIEEHVEDQGQSLQLITSSEDGTVLIWDLLKDPVVIPGGFKSTRKMRRLKKRPSALLAEESPFKKLHLNLKPIYKINIIHPFENSRILSISSFFATYFTTIYEPMNSNTVLEINDRIFYRPILKMVNSNPDKSFFIGSMAGDFIQASWEGQEFDSGEMINWEDCQFVSYGKYHDGPIVSIDYSNKVNAILTVGGKIFALWREDLPSNPILWRKTKSIYTAGSFYAYGQASVKLIRIDGNIEDWSILEKSNSAVATNLASNGFVSAVATHPRKLKRNIVGLCDYRGCFSLFTVGHREPSMIAAREEFMSKFLTSENERKKAFLRWQEEWNRQNVQTEMKKETEDKSAIDSEKSKKSKEVVMKEKKTVSPGPRHFQIAEQHQAHEQARIRSIILEKKRLNPKELARLRQPLSKLEDEIEVKMCKQKHKLGKSQKIFGDTVAMLFPDIIKGKPSTPPDPYQDCYETGIKEESFYNFQNLSIQAQDYVDNNPFKYDFNWKETVKAGRERRKRLDGSIENNRYQRRNAVLKDKIIKVAESEAIEMSGTGESF